MAEFKKTPKGQSGDGPFDAITPEMLGQFAATYWPVVLGGIVLFVLIALDKERIAIPVGITVVLLQAWRLGVFG